MHFTHIRRRILKIKSCVENLGFEEHNDDDNKNKPMTLIVDSSGLTISKKDDYIEEKWIREKKESIKLHISVDEESKKVVSFRITKGNVHDTKESLVS
jgi:hypothetical protein